MNKDELKKVAQGDIHFTFKSIVYAVALCCLVVSLFIFELDTHLKTGLIVCIIALFGSSIYENLNTRLTAALKLIELSDKNSQ